MKIGAGDCRVQWAERLGEGGQLAAGRGLYDELCSERPKSPHWWLAAFQYELRWAFTNGTFYCPLGTGDPLKAARGERGDGLGAGA